MENEVVGSKTITDTLRGFAAAARLGLVWPAAYDS